LSPYFGASVRGWDCGDANGEGGFHGFKL